MKHNDFNSCTKALAQYFIEQDSTDYSFYGTQMYSDLGYKKACETDADDGKGGAYVQFAMNLTHVPLVIPISLCLPKVCGDEALFKTLMDYGNKLAANALALAHQKIDFDRLYYSVPNGTIDTVLGKQLAGLVYNGTSLQLTAHVPS